MGWTTVAIVNCCQRSKGFRTNYWWDHKTFPHLSGIFPPFLRNISIGCLLKKRKRHCNGFPGVDLEHCHTNDYANAQWFQMWRKWNSSFHSVNDDHLITFLCEVRNTFAQFTDLCFWSQFRVELVITTLKRNCMESKNKHQNNLRPIILDFEKSYTIHQT